uniref:Uncharacterized protein n=1 Tax=viral metagenome TaxID=1070528 RepID=A0A6C0KTV4_9ZZZZ
MATSCDSMITVENLEIPTHIPPVKIIELRDRTIVVLHFLKAEEKPLKSTNAYCNLGTQFKFTLIYRPVSFRHPFNFTTDDKGKLLGENDMVIMFCNPFVQDGKFEDVDLRTNLLLFFIENIEHLTRAPCVLFYTVKMKLKQSETFFESDLKHFLRDYPAVFSLKYSKIASKVRILNVNYTDVVLPTSMYTTLYQGNYVLIKSKLTDKQKSSDILECQWWFSDEILKAFGCGKGRLRQFAGTCFLNSVVNGLILSDSARALCINEMNTQASADDALKTIIKKPITEIACPDFKGGRKEFFYNILYNIVCEDKQLTLPPALDVFVDVSAKLFCSNPSITNQREKGYGSGGETISAMINLVHDINIDGFIMLNIAKCSVLKKLYHKFAVVDQKDTYLELSRKLFDDVYHTQVDDTTRTKFSDKQCCLYLPQFPMVSSTKLYGVPLIITYYESTFLLCFGIISFSFTDKMKKTYSGHALLGLICNDMFLLYDSESNQFIDFDWTNMGTIDNQRSIIKILSDMYEGIELINSVKVDMAFYINKSAKIPVPLCQV